jgi:hypothetical protein
MKVVVILGHPRADDTLCAALAKASVDGARAAGCDVRLIDLGRMEFNPDVEERSPASQPLEPCLEAARQDIDWANHLTPQHGQVGLPGSTAAAVGSAWEFETASNSRARAMLSARVPLAKMP